MTRYTDRNTCPAAKASADRFRATVAAEVLGWRELRTCSEFGELCGIPPEASCGSGKPVKLYPVMLAPDPERSAADDFAVLQHVRGTFTSDEMIRFSAVLQENWELRDGTGDHTDYRPGDYARAALTVRRPPPPAPSITRRPERTDCPI